MSDHYLDIPSSFHVEIGSDTRLVSIIPEGTTPSALEMLEKIYLACQLEQNTQTTTLKCTPPQAVASSIATKVTELRCAVFGLSPKQIGALWTVPLYQWIEVGNVNWCFAERLEDIEDDIEKKKRLWNCLKILKAS